LEKRQEYGHSQKILALQKMSFWGDFSTSEYMTFWGDFGVKIKNKHAKV
jgi:hypothetical protein